MLGPGALVWTSDVEGAIGTGDVFSYAFDTPGTRVVTLTATDGDGNTGTDQVTLLIQEDCP
jgi:hypothetical protein